MNHAAHTWIVAVILGLLAMSTATAHAGTTPEEVKAFEGYKALAEKGDRVAQYNLGNSYLNGKGVAKNDAHAVLWYRKAAEQGFTYAQTNLGFRYFNGNGVAKDQGEAVKWYMKSAHQGDAVAQFLLGNCYHEGKGVAKDEIEAYAYWVLAGSSNRAARTEISNLEKQMSGDQIVAGKKRAMELQKEIDAKIAAKAAGK